MPVCLKYGFAPLYGYRSPSLPARKDSRCTARFATAPVDAKRPIRQSKKSQIVLYDGVEFVVDENPELMSTWSQRAIVGGSALASALLLAQGWHNCDSNVFGGMAMLLGFVFADFGSGVYHWGVDNYGSAKTPLVGTQIAAFQGHHQRPWTITQREFCNNCSLTFKPAGVAAAGFLALSVAGVTNPTWDIFAATSIFFIAMSQQLHAWSHMTKSTLPAAIVAMQDANLIISRKAHGQHHRSPFNVNYCIVNGWCNPVLDAGLMLRMEKFIYRISGVQARGWSEPLAEWKEMSPSDLE